MSLKDKRIAILTKIEALRGIEKRTQSEQRELVEAGRLLESNVFEREVEAINSTFEERRDQAMKNTVNPRISTPSQPGDFYGGCAEQRSDLIPEYRDRQGNPVYVLNREQRMVDLPTRADFKNDMGQRLHLSAGKMVRGWLTGKWTDAEGEQRALSGIVNSTGGYLVPDPLSAQVIDMARARSVLARLGMRTVPMESATLDIARQESDPEFGAYGEGATISEATMTFGRIQLCAQKIGCIVKASRELLEDAPNASAIIEGAMAAALACELDRQGLVGNGSTELTGVYNMSGINTTASVGTPTDYTEILAAYTQVLTANGQPNGYIISPRDFSTFEGLLDGVGGGYLTPPRSIDALQREITSAIPIVNSPGASEGCAFLGDFTTLLWGVKREIEVAVADQTYFASDEIGFRVTARVDIAAERPAWLTRLTGITHA